MQQDRHRPTVGQQHLPSAKPIPNNQTDDAKCPFHVCVRILIGENYIEGSNEGNSGNDDTDS